jgi:hypothetical protein
VIGELDVTALYRDGRQAGVYVRSAPDRCLATRAVLGDDCGLTIDAVNGRWRYKAVGSITRPGDDPAAAQLGDVLLLELVERPESEEP